MKKKRSNNNYSTPTTRYFAFSVAELMIVLLIMSIILAMTMPILSKRVKMKAAASAGGFINLPIKKEGDYCPDPVDGQVDKNLAVTADRSTLLICMPEAAADGSCTDIGAQAVQWDDTNKTITRLVCQNDTP